MSLSSGTGSSSSGASLGHDETLDNRNTNRSSPNSQQQQQQQQPIQPPTQQPQQQQHQARLQNRFELSLGGTNNLLNLANIDHANLLNQQQQFRADILADQQQQQHLQQQQQQVSPSSVLSLSTTASIDGSSSSSSSNAPSTARGALETFSSGGANACGGNVFHTCDAGHYTQSGSNHQFTSDSRIYPLDSPVDAPPMGAQSQYHHHYYHNPHQQQQQLPHHHHHHHQHQQHRYLGSSVDQRYNDTQQHTMSESDTTADIQSLTSQFNLSVLAQSNLFDQPVQSSSSIGGGSGGYSNQLLQSSSSSSVGCTFVQGHGHYFTKKTFHKPSYCHHCADLLWGIIGQGYICEVCNFVVHERCMKTVVSCCSTVASSAIKNPMPHCWTDAHPKRKFCHVCRKRIEDNAFAIRCCVCEYCVHSDCQEFSISDCKECATYVPDMKLDDINQRHHWREGNLSQGSSKCFGCKKSCWSAECLTGMRCEWCQMTAHASCLRNVPSECDFGSLKSIILPPYSVSIPRTDVPLETIIGVQNRNANQSGGGSGNTGPSSGGGSTGAQVNLGGSATKRDNLSPRSTSEDFSQLANQEDTISRDRDEETIRVYDGNSAIKKRSFRWVPVLRTANKEQLIAACLRALHVHDDVSHYVLIDINDKDPEKELTDAMPVLSLIKKDKRPSVLLRYRPPDSTMGTIKVYPGRLNVTDTFSSVQVTSDTNVDDVMIRALEQFRLDSTDLNRYRLVEVSLDKGSSVHERTMDNQECPWEIIKNVARESVRQKENTRFYLQQKDDVYCSSVAIFVGNLPIGMNQIQTESALLEILGKPYRFKECNPIYYEYGSCIITYDNADIAVKAFYMLRGSKVPDVKPADDGESRNLLVLLLPNIMPDMIPEGVKPLLVFVNVKSGGCQGLELITSFRKLLNPYQVYDLEKGGPLPGLYVFRKIRDYRILVCGGDGSVGWVLQCLDNAGQESECQSPPCAVVPLGTGNDLARVLRWGSGYTGAEDPLNLLKDVIDAEEVILDRWTVVFHPDEPNKQEVPTSLTIKPGTSSGAEDNTNMLVMNNYLGLGIDADLCLGFHNAREENPDKFNSRLHNKGVYVKQAFRKIVNRKPWSNLNKEIVLEVDGKVVNLPHIEGIIILNILSWGSGANPWGLEAEDRFAKPNHYDGLLEVVGVTGIVHMGQIQGGLSRGIRIAQGGQIKIRLNTEMPIQVDGEPWIQTPGRVNIIKSALKATMLRKTKMKRRNTEPTLTQAERLLSVDKANAVINEKLDE